LFVYDKLLDSKEVSVLNVSTYIEVARVFYCNVLEPFGLALLVLYSACGSAYQLFITSQ